ncbi:MAG: prohibitin family protein [Chitinophagaceae bacterium]|nr:prohibitin family protein [Chitinophagaceae bacterium]
MAVSNQPIVGAVKKYGSILSVLFISIGFVSSCIVQLNAGQIGVQSLFGKIQSRTLSEGLNIVNPLVSVRKIDVKTQNYTMSAKHNEGDIEGDDAIRALTKDGLELVIDLSVLYRVSASDAPNLIRLVGPDYIDKIVRPITRTKIRDNSVYYDAVELYSTKRDEYQVRITKDIEVEFKKRGLILENILVRNITLPETVKKAIEEKIRTEQESQKMQYVLSKEKQEADRKRVEAQGIADYQKIIGEGLSDKQLKYEQIKAYKELANSENAKVIIMPNNGSNIIVDGK